MRADLGADHRRARDAGIGHVVEIQQPNVGGIGAIGSDGVDSARRADVGGEDLDLVEAALEVAADLEERVLRVGDFVGYKRVEVDHHGEAVAIHNDDDSVPEALEGGHVIDGHAALYFVAIEEGDLGAGHLKPEVGGAGVVALPGHDDGIVIKLWPILEIHPRREGDARKGGRQRGGGVAIELEGNLRVGHLRSGAGDDAAVVGETNEVAVRHEGLRRGIAGGRFPRAVDVLGGCKFAGVLGVVFVIGKISFLGTVVLVVRRIGEGVLPGKGDVVGAPGGG
mmetsp:Transcript_37685/g.118932  ORF Transcript_37685/g.118932 Transcript_37685/m.118932 type:complete len:281 (-) Transcript_37685:1413-2255(-)